MLHFYPTEFLKFRLPTVAYFSMLPYGIISISIRQHKKNYSRKIGRFISSFFQRQPAFSRLRPQLYHLAHFHKKLSPGFSDIPLRDFMYDTVHIPRFSSKQPQKYVVHTSDICQRSGIASGRQVWPSWQP